MNFDQLLKFCADQKASDLHLQAGSIPMLRIGRQLRGVEGAMVEEGELRLFLQSIVPPGEEDDLDGFMRAGRPFVHEIPGIARVRGQLASHLGKPSATLRMIPKTIPTFEQLNLPALVREVAVGRRGLILIGGEAGSGRTTTLASLVDQINGTQLAKIITLEAPTEYRHEPRKALVSQRSVPRDVPTIAEGLSRCLREDPDVVAVGELSGADSLRHILRLTEAGRQVLAVCDGSHPLQIIDRLLTPIMGAEQKTVMRQLATSLEAIIAQRMAVTRQGKLRPAVEIMRGGPYVTRALLEGRASDLANYTSGRQGGMQTIDQHLIEMYQAGEISGTEAMRLSTSPETVALELRGSKPA